MLRLNFILLWCLALVGCERPETLLERIQADDELIVVTRNAATTYYEGPQGLTGLEYDLVQLFARHLGVKARFVVPRDFADILTMIERGNAHLAAAGLSDTTERRSRVRFGPHYQTILPQLVYRSGTDRKPPRSLDDLTGVLEVILGSSHEERLRVLRAEQPTLAWRSTSTQDSAELLQKVWEKEIDYTVADSNDVAIHQRFYPELRVAFDINVPEHLAWAFMKSPDESLYQEAVKFFAKLHDSGKLDQLLEKHYGHLQTFDYVGTRRYLGHIQQRLPEFIPLFEAAAAKTGLDWRLIAAVGYQESHWDPLAQSPTGVRGLMMLTRNTLSHLGLSDREDPRQSIEGGALYIRMLKEKLPATINEPDRTWLALAAYNVGYGHMQDARILTKKRAADPNKWNDVKKALPLLSKQSWYQQTKHGYARGYEPVRFVENIRSYYDILVWDSEQTPETEDSIQKFFNDLLDF